MVPPVVPTPSTTPTAVSVPLVRTAKSAVQLLTVAVPNMCTSLLPMSSSAPGRWAATGGSQKYRPISPMLTGALALVEKGAKVAFMSVPHTRAVCRALIYCQDTHRSGKRLTERINRSAVVGCLRFRRACTGCFYACVLPDGTGTVKTAGIGSSRAQQAQAHCGQFVSNTPAHG